MLQVVSNKSLEHRDLVIHNDAGGTLVSLLASISSFPKIERLAGHTWIVHGLGTLGLCFLRFFRAPLSNHISCCDPLDTWYALLGRATWMRKPSGKYAPVRAYYFGSSNLNESSNANNEE